MTFSKNEKPLRDRLQVLLLIFSEFEQINEFLFLRKLSGGIEKQHRVVMG